MFSLLDLRFVLCSRDLDVRKGLWEFLILIPLNQQDQKIRSLGIIKVKGDWQEILKSGRELVYKEETLSVFSLC